MFKILNWLLNATIAVAVFLMGAALFSKYAGTPPWAAGTLLVIIGVALYLGNIFLIQSYVTRKAPKFANNEMLEITACLGIVPKWVSFLGLLAIPAFIAAGIWFFQWYWAD